MQRSPRTLTLALVLSLPMLGCNSGRDDNGTLTPSGRILPPRDAFSDEFRGTFPGANWIVEEGTPAVDLVQGNPEPGLSMTDNERARTRFVISTQGPLTLSIDLGIPGFQAGQLGRARIDLETELGGPDNSAEIRLEDGTIDFEILDDETEVAFAGDADFHTFTFRVDENQVATWSLDGVVIATQGDFPVQFVQLDLRVDQDATATFVFDNVSLDTTN